MAVEIDVAIRYAALNGDVGCEVTDFGGAAHRLLAVGERHSVTCVHLLEHHRAAGCDVDKRPQRDCRADLHTFGVAQDEVTHREELLAVANPSVHRDNLVAHGDAVELHSIAAQHPRAVVLLHETDTEFRDIGIDSRNIYDCIVQKTYFRTAASIDTSLLHFELINSGHSYFKFFVATKIVLLTEISYLCIAARLVRFVRRCTGIK